MMPTNAVQVVNQFQDARYNNDGTVTQLYRVRFMVGKFGPFLETFELDTFTSAARDARLQERARHIWVDPPSTP